MYILRARTFLESGNVRKGIKFIEKNTKFMVDDIRRIEILAEMFVKNKQVKKAIEQYENLLKLNPDNKDYIIAIIKVSNIDMQNEDQVIEIIQKYEELLPKSNTHSRLSLDLLPHGENFNNRLLKYLRP